MVAILVSSLLTAGYFFRVFQRVWAESPAGSESSFTETPVSMRLSLGTLTVGILALGLGSDLVIGMILESAIPKGF